ncbi:hypothetical protein CBF23_006245 [Marinomonas agarivorans]|nr:hypothetical protein CBF23_006245 [Marinomonas agarivorans]
MFSEQDLVHIAREKMPFGKYSGRLIIDLPEAYLLWFQNEGWPDGKLGQWLQLTLEIKINGLEALVEPLKEKTTVQSSAIKTRIRF